MIIRDLLEKAGFELVTTDPATNLFTGRLVFNTTSNVLRIYFGGIWNTVGASAAATGNVNFEAVIDSNLDLSGITADAIDYGYFLYPATVPEDVPRTVNLPATGSGEFNKIGVKIFSGYYDDITISAADSANIRNEAGGLSTSYIVKGKRYVVLFWDPDVNAWVVTDSPILNIAQTGKSLQINTSINLEDFYVTNRVSSQVSDYNIPASIINQSVAGGTTVTLFDKDTTNTFIQSSKISIYNPTQYTMVASGFGGQTITNDLEGTTPTSITLAPYSYYIFELENGAAWHLVDSSNVRFSATADAVTTGTDQDVVPTQYNIIEFSEGSLESIRSFDPSPLKVLYISNGQGAQSITLVNESAGATPANRIITGIGDDLLIEPGQTLPLVYDDERDRWLVVGGTGSGGGGLENEYVVFADSPVTAEIGKHYLTDTTGGAIVFNMPQIASIPSSQSAQARIKFSDSAGNWHVDDITVNAFAGDDMIFGDATTDTVLFANVQGQNIEFNGLTTTRWAMDSNFQPVPITGGGGSGGEGGRNYYVGGNFNDLETTGWASTGDFSDVAIETVAPLEGDGSLTFTATATSGTGQVTGEINPQDEIDLGNVIGHDGGIKVTGSGEYSAKLVNTTTATDLIDWGTFTATASGILLKLPGTFIGTEDTIRFELDMVNSVSGDTFILDGFKADPDGAGQGSVNGWPSYEADTLSYTNISQFSSIEGGTLTPYKDPLTGQWRLRGESLAINALVSTTNIRFTIDNTTFDVKTPSTDIVGVGTATSNLGGGTTQQGRVDIFASDATIPNQVRVQYSSADTIIVFNFDAPLTEKPTWATKSDLSVQLLNGGTIYQTSKFSAYSSNEVVANNATVPFATPDYNEGGGSFVSGQYFVPTTGYYDTAVVIRTNVIGSQEFALEVNGVQEGSGFISSEAGVSFNKTVYAEAGQTIEVVNISGASRTTLNATNKSWLDIKRSPGSSANQAIGAGTSLVANETEQYLVHRGQTKTIAADASFSSGNFICEIIGNRVFISSDSVLSHISTGTPSTSAGLIPEPYRPAADYSDTYYHDTTSACSVIVTTAGTLSIRYRDDAGVPTRTDTQFAFSIDYPLA